MVQTAYVFWKVLVVLVVLVKIAPLFVHFGLISTELLLIQNGKTMSSEKRNKNITENGEVVWALKVHNPTHGLALLLRYGDLGGTNRKLLQ